MMIDQLHIGWTLFTCICKLLALIAFGLTSHQIERNKTANLHHLFLLLVILAAGGAGGGKIVVE